MIMKQLNEQQIAAIDYLARNDHGLTHEQIAEKVGVTVRTLYRWKKDHAFVAEWKHQIIRESIERLPEVMESMADNIIETGNAAGFRTYIQLHGMLTEQVSVETTSGSGLDAADLRAEIKRLRGLPG